MNGLVIAAEFVRGQEPNCLDCDDECCPCCAQADSLPPGTYITIRLDDDLTPVRAGKVTIAYEQ